LLLAIPVQGIATVAATQCMAFGHHQDAGSQGHGHHAQDDGADGHDHAAHQNADEKTSHCGPCTACCASASIAGSAGLAISVSVPHTKSSFSPLAPPSVEPQRFDRPPLPL
jgi:hypothetical protein